MKHDCFFLLLNNKSGLSSILLWHCSFYTARVMVYCYQYRFICILGLRISRYTNLRLPMYLIIYASYFSAYIATNLKMLRTNLSLEHISLIGLLQQSKPVLRNKSWHIIIQQIAFHAAIPQKYIL